MQAVVSIILLALGCYGVYWTNKRRFDRRNMAGVEEFSSYSKAVATRGGETIVRLASWILVLFGGVGTIVALFR